MMALATRIFAVVTLPILSTSVVASQSTLLTDFGSRLEYTDNVFFSAQNVVSASSLVLIPQLKYKHNTELFDSSVSFKLRNYQYDKSQLNNSDYFLRSRASLRREKSTFSGSLNYEASSNLDLNSFNSGLLEQQNTKKTLNITPQYTYRLTGSTLVSTSYTLNDVGYDGVQNQFVDYSTDTLTLSLSHNLTLRTGFTLLARQVDYESDDGLSMYDLNILELGMNHQFSPLSMLSVSVGATKRDTVSAGAPINLFGVSFVPLGIRAESNGIIFNLNWKMSMTERLTQEVNLNRSNVSDSFGGLNEVDTLKLDYKYRVSELSDFTTTIILEDVSSLTAGLAFTDRTTSTLTLKWKQSLTRSLESNLSYNYSSRDFANQLGVRGIESHTIFAGISYKFSRLEF